MFFRKPSLFCFLGSIFFSLSVEASLQTKLRFQFCGKIPGVYSASCSGQSKETLLEIENANYPQQREEIFRESPLHCEFTNEGTETLEVMIIYDNEEAKPIVRTIKIPPTSKHLFEFEQKVAVVPDERKDQIRVTDPSLDALKATRQRTRTFQGQHYDPMNDKVDFSVIK